MAWWVYKCNSRNDEHQVAYGDWEQFFVNGIESEWGSSEWTRDILRLQPNDNIVAYQTNRNELVGLATVKNFVKRARFKDVILVPGQRIGIHVRPLRQSDERIAEIPAFKPGPIRTLYSIDEDDVFHLLKAAGVQPERLVPNFDTVKTTDPEQEFIEGERRAWLSTVRSAKLRSAAKRRWGLACYCCGFDFGVFYGEIGTGCAIVHHLENFSALKGQQRKTGTDRVRIVCANCHQIIHRRNPQWDVDDLKEFIANRWVSWTADGVGLK